MERRTVLTTAVTTLPLFSLGGCLAENTSETSPADNGSNTSDTENTTDTDPVDTVETIEISVYNEAAAELTAHLTVSGNNTVPVDTEFVIPVDERVSTNSGITETGEYTLAIELADGREKTWSVSIGSYSLQEGTDMSIAIQTDEFNFLKET